MKILSFGSLNIDNVYYVDKIVKKSETILSNEYKQNVGGKGLNQSIALARAGGDVYHAGKIGKDGKFLLQYLEREGVNIENIYIDNSIESGRAIIQIDRQGDNCIIVFGGANRKIELKQIDEVLSKFCEKDVIVLSNEINELGYIIKKAKEKKMCVALNVSPIDANVKNLPIKMCDFIFVNEIEGSAISNSCGDIESILKFAYDNYYNSVFVLTCGEKGVYATKEGNIYYKEAKKVKVVDTVSAGDTFCGYFLTQFLEHNNIKEALEIASKASALCVSTIGASSSIPKLAEVKK